MTEPTGGQIEAADSGPAQLAPLPGEPGIPDVASTGPGWRASRKGLLAVGLAVVGVVGIGSLWAHQFLAGSPKADVADNPRVSDKPAAATASPRRLDMPAPAAGARAAAPSSSAAAAPQTDAASGPWVPALVPTDAERAEAAQPIGVRRSATGTAPGRNPTKGVAPEDAPVLVVSTRPGAHPGQKDGAHSADEATAGSGPEGAAPGADGADPMAATTRNLQAYQRQLQGLLDSLTQSTALAGGQGRAFDQPTGAGAPVADLGTTPAAARAPSPTGGPHSGGSLFGGQLAASDTPRVAAGHLGDRSLTLPKGTAFTCALKTKVISAASGLVGCQVQRNVFSDDGRVLLIERGSHLDGEYRITNVRPGMVRIPVLWTRIRTPLGVTVDIHSPGTGALGESGIDGHVDNRWNERLGAAMLLSLIDDSVKLVIQNQASDRLGDTLVLPSTTANTSRLAEKVLDSTINIPPLIYQNQGGIVGIYVARDVDFSSVYSLRPLPREGAR